MIGGKLSPVDTEFFSVSSITINLYKMIKIMTPFCFLCLIQALVDTVSITLKSLKGILCVRT